ncbi:MAG: hydroxymethylbilane synthase, partial [Alphaproteobacteria bacterium]|nr:hydroxymethylbilane synthase [Alphaproteobacteria bacterium]
AVHSLKDMPTELLAGLQITAVPEREVVADFLIVSAATAALMAAIEIEQLPHQSRVGTSSLRRALQLQEQRPDLQIVPLRGNIGTRLKKLAAGEVAATVLAEAGLKRLGLCQDQIIGAAIPMKTMIPAVAQGALAIETTVDSPVIPWVVAIDHRTTHLAILAERAMLRLLDGSCRTPIGGVTEWRADGSLRLVGGLASSNGRRMIRAESSAVVLDGAAAVSLGQAVGQELLLRRAQGSDSVD